MDDNNNYGKHAMGGDNWAPSSRVLQQPGGASSINLFGGAVSPQQAPAPRRAGGARIVGGKIILPENEASEQACTPCRGTSAGFFKKWPAGVSRQAGRGQVRPSDGETRGKRRVSCAEKSSSFSTSQPSLEHDPHRRMRSCLLQQAARRGGLNVTSAVCCGGSCQP